jgi:catechol 2,3-dioxygenase-like lactoylglutathione lyase family enzyme
LVPPDLSLQLNPLGKEGSAMKRLHVHVAVDDLDKAIGFYATLFGTDPSVRHGDYAKWMLEDPRVNFAISSRGTAPGVDHLGIQVENEAELAAVAGRLKAAERPVLEQEGATCCYARSDKTWVMDPQGIAWETFLTHGQSTVYGEDGAMAQLKAASACCTPEKADPAPAPVAGKGCCAA